MLDALPLALLTVVSRFLMPGDANCFVRSFKDVEIDWMKVLFNYARVEALHIEWCMVVDGLSRAKSFFTNHKYNSVTFNRAIRMFWAIRQHNLTNLRKEIHDCPKLFRLHVFTLDDLFFPYHAKYKDPETNVEKYMYGYVSPSNVMPDMIDEAELYDHRAMKMTEWLNMEFTREDASFKQLVTDMYATFSEYFVGTGQCDNLMMNLHCRTAIVDLRKLLFEGELYGSCSSEVPMYR